MDLEHIDIDKELATRVTDEHRHKADAAMKNFALSGDKLFGIIPIPAQISKFVAMLVPPMISFATKEATDFTEKVRPGAGKYVKVALPLALYAQPAVADVIAYKKEITAFNRKLQPLFNANKADESGMGKLFDSGQRPNAIITFARNQKHGRHLNKLLGHGVESGVGYGYQLIVNNKTLQARVDGVTNNEMIKEHFQGQGFNPQHIVGGLVGSVGSWLKEVVTGYLPEEYKGNCALNLCYSFIDDMDAAAKNLDPLDKKGMEREIREQSRKLIEIFKERYRESGWKAMPERVQEKLEEVTEQMVRPMLMGELSPLAVINLAGEGRILQNGGRSVASESEVKAALEEQMNKLSMQRMMSLDDFQSETELRVSDIAGAWKTLGPEENAFLSIVVPDVVLLKAGMTKEQIAEFHAKGDKTFTTMAEGIIGVMAKEPAEKLRDKFSKAEIAQLRELDEALTRINDTPHRREDDLEVMDEKDRLTHTSAVRKLLAKSYLGAEKPAKWKSLLEEHKENKEEEAEAKEKCETKSKHSKYDRDEEPDEERETTKHRDAHADKKKDSHLSHAERGHGSHHDR